MADGLFAYSFTLSLFRWVTLDIAVAFVAGEHRRQCEYLLIRAYTFKERLFR